MRFTTSRAARGLPAVALGLLLVVPLLSGCGQNTFGNGLTTSSITTGSTTPRSTPQNPPRPYTWNGRPAYAYGNYGQPPPTYGGYRQQPAPPFRPYTQPRTAAYGTYGYKPAPAYGTQPRQPTTVWRASPRPPARPVTQPATAGYARTVEVMGGDTLYSIARRHGVTVASLVDTNRLSGIEIHPGQRLLLPTGAR